jgi:hypothetical protein
MAVSTAAHARGGATPEQARPSHLPWVVSFDPVAVRLDFYKGVARRFADSGIAVGSFDLDYRSSSIRLVDSRAVEQGLIVCGDRRDCEFRYFHLGFSGWTWYCDSEFHSPVAGMSMLIQRVSGIDTDFHRAQHRSGTTFESEIEAVKDQ